MRLHVLVCLTSITVIFCITFKICVSFMSFKTEIFVVWTRRDIFACNHYGLLSLLLADDCCNVGSKVMDLYLVFNKYYTVSAAISSIFILLVKLEKFSK